MGTSQLTRDQDIKFELENVMYQRLSRTLLGIHLSASRGRVSRSCPPLFRGQSLSARWRRKGRKGLLILELSCDWDVGTIRSVFRFIIDLDLCSSALTVYHVAVLWTDSPASFLNGFTFGRWSCQCLGSSPLSRMMVDSSLGVRLEVEISDRHIVLQRLMFGPYSSCGDGFNCVLVLAEGLRNRKASSASWISENIEITLRMSSVLNSLVVVRGICIVCDRPSACLRTV